MRIPCGSDAARDCFFLPMPLKFHGDAGISVSGRMNGYVAMW